MNRYRGKPGHKGHRKPSNHDTYELVVTSWDDLDGRRRVARFCMMYTYKAINGLVALPTSHLNINQIHHAREDVSITSNI